jgi:hypothetical protein
VRDDWGDIQNRTTWTNSNQRLSAVACHECKLIGIMGYDTVPFGFVLGLESTSIVSSKSFAEGTAADVAAPAAARSCCEGATSLVNIRAYQLLTSSCANDFHTHHLI